MDLEELGWTSHFAAVFAPHAAAGSTPARVAGESREIYRLYTPAGERSGELAGALRYRAAGPADLPAVGDWVAARTFAGDERAIVHAVLPRATSLLRRAAGRRTAAQVLAANVDVVLVVTSLNQEFNQRRLERYLEAARAGGAPAAVVLSKSDLVADPEAWVERARAVAGGAPVHAASALTGAGLDDLRPLLAPRRTLVLVGSSGVGKSTLVNRLAGEALQATAPVLEDDRGRHTTARRELLRLPGGAWLVDTPGLRELGLWEPDGEEPLFDDVAALATGCRFRDCRHEVEPGCAVRAAVAAGGLDPGRLPAYHKLRREAAFLELRRATTPSHAEKQRWRAFRSQLDPEARGRHRRR